MKAKLSLLSLAVCAAFGASSAFAQTGTINFTGTVQSGNCTIAFGGAGSGSGKVSDGPVAGVVNVGNIDAALLATANQPAGGVDFTVDLTDCSGSQYFVVFSAVGGSATSQVNGSGRLVTNLSNISLQLVDGGINGTPIQFRAGVPDQTVLNTLSADTNHSGAAANFGVAAALADTKTYGVRWFHEGAAPVGTGSLQGVSATFHAVYH